MRTYAAAYGMVGTWILAFASMTFICRHLIYQMLATDMINHVPTNQMSGFSGRSASSGTLLDSRLSKKDTKKGRNNG